MGKSRIQIGKIIKVKNDFYKIYRSDRKHKKYMAKNIETGETIHFGQKGYFVRTGTARGNRYCARSEKIGNPIKVTSNTFARILWNCNKNISEIY